MNTAEGKRALETDVSNAIYKALTNGVDQVDVLDVLRTQVAELVATIKASKEKRKWTR